MHVVHFVISMSQKKHKRMQRTSSHEGDLRESLTLKDAKS